jgi:hypothetical protein
MFRTMVDLPTWKSAHQTANGGRCSSTKERESSIANLEKLSKLLVMLMDRMFSSHTNQTTPTNRSSTSGTLTTQKLTESTQKER